MAVWSLVCHIGIIIFINIIIMIVRWCDVCVQFIYSYCCCCCCCVYIVSLYCSAQQTKYMFVVCHRELFDWNDHRWRVEVHFLPHQLIRSWNLKSHKFILNIRAARTDTVFHTNETTIRIRQWWSHRDDDGNDDDDVGTFCFVFAFQRKNKKNGKKTFFFFLLMKKNTKKLNAFFLLISLSLSVGRLDDGSCVCVATHFLCVNLCAHGARVCMQWHRHTSLAVG